MTTPLNQEAATPEQNGYLKAQLNDLVDRIISSIDPAAGPAANRAIIEEISSALDKLIAESAAAGSETKTERLKKFKQDALMKASMAYATGFIGAQQTPTDTLSGVARRFAVSEDPIVLWLMQQFVDEYLAMLVSVSEEQRKVPFIGDLQDSDQAGAASAGVDAAYLTRLYTEDERADLISNLKRSRKFTQNFRRAMMHVVSIPQAMLLLSKQAAEESLGRQGQEQPLTWASFIQDFLNDSVYDDLHTYQMRLVFLKLYGPNMLDLGKVLDFSAFPSEDVARAEMSSFVKSYDSHYNELVNAYKAAHPKFNGMEIQGEFSLDNDE